MAITFDNKVINSFFGTNVLTTSFTVGSYSGHAMLVAIFTSGSANGNTSTLSLVTTTGMTYNGVNMTRLAGQSNAFGEANENAELWYMADPPTGAHNIVCTMNGTPSGNPNGFQVQAASYFGAGVLTMSGGSSNTSTSASSITISSATGSLVVAGGLMTESHSSTAPADSAGQTARELLPTFWANATANSDGWGALSDKAGAASVTISYTQTNRNHATMVGGSIDEAASGVTGTGAVSMIIMAAQGTGTEKFTGTATVAMIKMAAQGSGGGTIVGTAAAAMARMTVVATGAEKFVATGAAAMIKMAAQGTGFLKLTGIGIVNMIKMAVVAIGASVVFEDYGVVRSVDPTKYSETAVYRLCAIMNCASASYPVRMRLWDDTNAEMLVEITSTSTTPEEVFSDPLDFPSTEVSLRVEIGGLSTQGPYHADAVDLVIDPV